MVSRVAFLCVLAFISCVACYTVVSNKVYDPYGKEILLRGVDRPSFEWNPKGENASLGDYSLIRDWGANVIRLSMNQNFWLPGASGYDSNYETTIDQQVKWIKSLGMGVILDLHWSNRGNLGSGAGQQNMADTYSNQFWQLVATKYKSDPWVIFELYNEPHDVSWTTWKSGGSDPGYQVYGMQQLLNTVRNAGADNAVIINGLNWAYDLSGVSSNSISGSHIIYGTHPYNNDGTKEGVSNWDSHFGYLTANYPVIATEFGQYCDNSQDYVKSFLQYCDQKGIHWTAWAWYPKDCAFPSIVADWHGTPTTPVGTLIKASLQSTKPVTSTSGGAAAAAVTSSSSSSSTGSKNPTTLPGSGSGSQSSSTVPTNPPPTPSSSSSASGSGAAAAASSSSSSTTGEACNVGAESCECTSGGSCDKGLTCLSGFCVNYAGIQSSVAASPAAICAVIASSAVLGTLFLS